jgi:cell division protein FtsZ
MLKFDLPKNQSSLIKVIGVGGGGSNAVNHMFHQGIRGVDFIICNTDAQAMEASPVPTKIQLGATLTGGLGAGAVPTVGKNAALENKEEIKSILEKGTKMLFITAGLGGGTGTGAAPVIASVARDLGILTVAIVTIPFSFEGRKRTQHAEEGIAELKKHVDALVLIRNDKLRELYGNLTLRAAFGHADDVLTTAAKGIAELITVTGYINVDFEDVKTVMKDSGVAIMGVGIADGEFRASQAIEQAMSSPLLCDDNVEGASNILLFITSGKDEIKMDEISEITDYIKGKTKSSTEVIWGNGIDESLEDKISVTIIATGFDEKHRSSNEPAKKPEKIIYTLDGKINVVKEDPKQEPAAEAEIETKPEPELPAFKMTIPELSFSAPEVTEPETTEPDLFDTQRTIVFDIKPIEMDEPESLPEAYISETTLYSGSSQMEVAEETIPFSTPYPLAIEPVNEGELSDQEKIQNERKQKLKQLSEKLKIHPSLDTNLYEIESVPAYKRRNIPLTDTIPSSQSQAPNYTVSTNPDKTENPINENKFLHNKAD